MDANTLATEVAPIIIQLPPKAVSTATAAVVVAAIAVIANIWVNNRTLKHQKESEEAKQKHEKEIEQIKRKHELEISKRKFLSEKYEEFSFYVQKTYSWSENLFYSVNESLEKRDFKEPQVSDIQSAITLSSLYFPKFNEDLIQLFQIQNNIASMARFYFYEGREFYKKNDDANFMSPDGETRIIKDKYLSNIESLQKNEFILIDKIIEDIRQNASKYTYSQTKESML